MNDPRRSLAGRARAVPPGAELQFAARVTALLTAGTEALPHDVTERLRFARERALDGVRARRVDAAPGSAGAARSAGIGVWWRRAAAALPLLLLVAGLVGIDQWSTREQVLAAAEIDAQLLGDDLPTDAYRDPGFAEYLRSAPPPS